MDFSKFKTPDWLMIGGGVGILIFGFLDWVDASITDSASRRRAATSFDFFWTGTHSVDPVIASAVVTCCSCRASLKEDQAPVADSILLVATASPRCCCCIRLIFNPIDGKDRDRGGRRRVGRGIGMILSVLAGIVAAVGGVPQLQGQGRRTARTSPT